MKEETKLVVLGRDSRANHGIVNPPVYHASTVLYPTVKDLESRSDWPPKSVTYGLHGTPTTFALEDAIAELEGGFDAVITPLGTVGHHPGPHGLSEGRGSPAHG